MIHSAGEPAPPVDILYLADHPEVLGTLAAGFKSQWSAHFADQPLDAIKMGFASCCREEGLPLALVAMSDGTFCGTATLRSESGTVCPDLGPWLTHLYVDPAWRDRGIGSLLVRAIEQEAARHGFNEIHAVTARAAELFEQLGWSRVEALEYHGDRVTVLRKTLQAHET